MQASARGVGPSGRANSAASMRTSVKLATSQIEAARAALQVT